MLFLLGCNIINPEVVFVFPLIVTFVFGLISTLRGLSPMVLLVNVFLAIVTFSAFLPILTRIEIGSGDGFVFS